MSSIRPPLALCVATLLVLFGVVTAAKIKVKVQFDEKFDFTKVKTWAWRAPEPGKVILLRSELDEPEKARARFEPSTMEAVTAALVRRGLTPAPAGQAPDVSVAYYLIVTVGVHTDYLGYNIPGSVSWVLPPFTPATTRVEVIQKGSVVVDMISAAKESVVWRGISEGSLDEGKTDEQRKTRITQAVDQALAKYPPKPVKK